MPPPPQSLQKATRITSTQCHHYRLRLGILPPSKTTNTKSKNSMYLKAPTVLYLPSYLRPLLPLPLYPLGLLPDTAIRSITIHNLIPSVHGEVKQGAFFCSMRRCGLHLQRVHSWYIRYWRIIVRWFWGALRRMSWGLVRTGVLMRVKQWWGGGVTEMTMCVQCRVWDSGTECESLKQYQWDSHLINVWTRSPQFGSSCYGPWYRIRVTIWLVMSESWNSNQCYKDTCLI